MLLVRLSGEPWTKSSQLIWPFVHVTLLQQAVPKSPLQSDLFRIWLVGLALAGAWASYVGSGPVLTLSRGCSSLH